MKAVVYQNLWDASKARLSGKHIAVDARITKDEMSQNNNLSFYLRTWKKKSK